MPTKRESTKLSAEEARFPALLQRLNSRKDLERMEAEQEILSLEDTFLNWLLVQVEQGSRREWQAILSYAGGLCFLSFLVIAALSAIQVDAASQWVFLIIVWTVFLLVAGTTYGISSSVRISRSKKSSIHALMLFNDSRTLAPLLRIVREDYMINRSDAGSYLWLKEERLVRAHIMRQLSNLLPDIALLTINPYRDWLYSPFDYLYEVDYNANILIELCDFIQRIQDIGTLEKVAAIVQAYPKTFKEIRVYKAMHYCEMFLEEIKRKRSGADLLLRPVDAPVQQNLLQPVEGIENRDTALLVRPASSSEVD